MARTLGHPGQRATGRAWSHRPRRPPLTGSPGPRPRSDLSQGTGGHRDRAPRRIGPRHRARPRRPHRTTATAAELGRLERESQELARSIIDTTTQLDAALASRDTGRNPSLEEIRRAAQVEWLAVRTNQPAIDVAPDKPRALDLSGDLAAARRDARDQWLAQRASALEPEQEKTVATNDAKAPSRIVLPDDDRAL